MSPTSCDGCDIHVLGSFRKSAGRAFGSGIACEAWSAFESSEIGFGDIIINRKIAL